MRAKELRTAFTQFFADRGHTVVPSASLIPHDPTVMFTVAGMVPFKPYFVGDEPAPWSRATSVQKCVRVGGKHNDLDEIGRTARHLSFFEMMGNFSFGDYFKERACALAWEFVTETIGLDPERLWVTVHVSDDAAEMIWRDQVGVPASRIQRLDEDNFWRMGDVGPCGPCSEIFWDKGPDYGEDGGPAHGGEERFVEIWNLVFMQYEQRPDGSMVDLPKPSIDTGLGLERLLAVLQGVDAVWDLDEIRELIATAERAAGVEYGTDERTDVSLRIIAEHSRTAAFLVGDGVVPSNEERGYVLRRIIRRAVAHAYLLGIETPVMPTVVDQVVRLMGADYPDLAEQADVVRETIEREEVRFRDTLRTGLNILDNEIEALDGGTTLDGAVAFQLHDTYGFPLEVTTEVVAARGVDVDRAGFDVAMADQRGRARDARKDAGRDDDAAEFARLSEANGPTVFERSVDQAEAVVVGVVGDSVVTDRTPFYAEAGGQIGDTGSLVRVSDGREFRVTDTTYGVAGIVRHVLESGADDLSVGDQVTLRIDGARRRAICRHHTATHLLHWALRDVLGDHVKQQGSWVGPDRLRFDFHHFSPLTPDEIRRIEDLVNAEVLSNAPTDNYETSKEEAVAKGAIAFFGDKYGDRVRVLQAGPHSVELCGGTHVGALGDIGLLNVVSESSIGSNIRRIEAVVGDGVVSRLRDAQAQISEAADLLGVPVDDLVAGVAKRQEEARSLRSDLADARRELARSQAGDLASAAIDGRVVAHVEAETRDEVRDLAVSLRDRPDIDVVVLGASPGGKGVALVAAVDPTSGLDAGELIGEAIRIVGGGGGKGSELATAGGRDVSRIDEALDDVRSRLGLG